jgi:hypothetical protein
MLRRFASRVSYANVAATLALFLALAGGGYALATIQGNGSVKFGGEKGLPNDQSFATVLNLPDFGKVQANCSKADTVRFKNTSGGQLYATAFSNDQADDPEAAHLANGDNLSEFAFAFNPATIRFHVYRPDANGQPMAEITASLDFGGGGCANNSVAAQAVMSP